MLMRVERHALRTIRRHHAPHGHSCLGRANLGVGIHLNGDHRQSGYRHHRDAGVDPRFRVVENCRPQVGGVGAGTMARAGTGDAAVILHADEKRAALAIGQADDILVE
jgi:hypothetical protein